LGASTFFVDDGGYRAAAGSPDPCDARHAFARQPRIFGGKPGCIAAGLQNCVRHRGSFASEPRIAGQDRCCGAAGLQNCAHPTGSFASQPRITGPQRCCSAAGLQNCARPPAVLQASREFPAHSARAQPAPTRNSEALSALRPWRQARIRHGRSSAHPPRAPLKAVKLHTFDAELICADSEHEVGADLVNGDSGNFDSAQKRALRLEDRPAHRVVARRNLRPGPAAPCAELVTRTAPFGSVSRVPCHSPAPSTAPHPATSSNPAHRRVRFMSTVPVGGRFVPQSASVPSGLPH
jgi:hypothetical protein